MDGPNFFEIPIYRCDINKFEAENEKAFQKFAESCHLMEDKEIRLHYTLNNWYSWKYNEIIGYLVLYILGSQIRIDHWKVEKTRYLRGINKKKFVNNRKISETTIPRELKSSQIMEFIVNELTLLQNKELKKYYLDLKTFKTIGDFVNWNKLIDDLNALKNPEIRNKY